MFSTITCSCGHQWEQTPAAKAVCPACGANTPHLATQPIAPRTIEPLGTIPVSIEKAADVPTTPPGLAPAGFEIVGLLGRGGMGVVYKARDTRLDRFVAIKTILAGPFAAPDLLNRFVTEATTVAKLEHPNIVQLHAVSEAGGQPCLVMEFLSGGNLGQRLQGQPQPPRACAEMVQTLARAVHSAHKAGVVHRDLKPANVLLAADGTPKIGDFGLAKQLDSGAGPTRSGDILGTPSYMAPEQAGGMTRQVTPLIDVYALGAILYEMLTGRPPFLADDPIRTVMQVLGAEPVPPRRLQPGVPLDLETICLKCLEKRPDKRYKSAEALAEDLQRFLDGKPVEARPANSFERLAKWVRRRPALAAMIGVSAAALLTLLGVGAWYQVRLYEAYRREQAARTSADQLNDKLTVAVAEEQKQRVKAEQHLRLAGDALQKFTETIESDLGAIPGTTHVRRRLQEEALPILQTLIDQDLTNPALRHLRARAVRRQGRAYLDLGDTAQAREKLQRAVAEYEALRKDSAPSAEVKRDLALTLNTLGQALEIKDDPQAEASYRQARELLIPLSKENADDPQNSDGLAMVDNNLALLLGRQQHFDEARVLLRESLKLRQELAQHWPDESRYSLEAARTLNSLGNVEDKAGQPDAAIDAYRAALKAFRQLPPSLADSFVCRRERMRTASNLGRCFEQQNRFDQADAAYRDAGTMAELLIEEFPFVPPFREEAIYFQRRRAFALTKLFGPAKAEEPYRKACRHAERLALDYPDNPTHTQTWLTVLRYRANALYGSGHKDEVGVLWRRVLESGREALRDRTDSHSPRLQAILQRSLADYLVSAGDFFGAWKQYHEAVREVRQAMTREPADANDRFALADTFYSLAITDLVLGRYEEATYLTEELPALDPSSWQGETHAATLQAKLVDAAMRDKSLTTERSGELVERAGARGVVLLRAAVKKGWPDAKTLGRQPEFTPLRSRADFQELVRDIEKAQHSPAK